MTLGSILLFLSSVGCLVAWIWFIVLAFRSGDKVWGILLIVGFILAPIGPIIALVFLVLRWNLVRQPAIIFLSSFVVGILGIVLFVSGAKRSLEEAVGGPEALAALRAQAEQAARQANAGAGGGGEPVAPPPAPAAAPATPPAAPPPPPAPRNSRPRSPGPDLASASDADRPAGLSPRETPPPPPPTHASLNPHLPPGRIELVSLGDVSPNQMRILRLRYINDSDEPAREVKFDLNYLDARGGRVGGWTTIHTPDAPIQGKGTTNEFDLQAFFVPQFTRDIRLEIRGVGFTNGTRWPAAH